MRIMWVTVQLPSLQSGGQVRQYHLLRGLAQTHDVTIVTFVDDGEHDAVSALRQLNLDVVTVRRPPAPTRTRLGNRWYMWRHRLFSPQPHYARIYPIERMRWATREIGHTWAPDVVHFEQLFTAPLSRLIGRTPWILGQQNVESLNFARQQSRTGGWQRRVQQLEAAKLRRWEARWVQRSDATVVVSEPDRQALAPLAAKTPLRIVPNGVDCADFASPADATRRDLLFFGNLNYRPNVDGLAWFLDAIWPRLRRARPNLKLRVVGGGGPHLDTLIAQPGVTRVGFVDDIRPELWRAAVSIVPLTSGGGTRLKILESMAAGCPVVSTPLGAEGLALQDDVHALLATDPAGFAAAVDRVLAEPVLAARLADAARDLVETTYSWEAIVPELARTYADVVAADKSRRRS